MTMLQGAGAFVDLGRSIATIGMLATQAELSVTRGSLTNVPRALQHERGIIRSVIEDVHAFPDAYAGAPDVAEGARLLQRAVDDLTGVIDTARGAIKVRTGNEALRLADVRAPGGDRLSDQLRRAAQSLDDGFGKLGGRRDLPEYRPGPAVDRSALQFADPLAPEIVARGHGTAHRMGRGLLHGGWAGCSASGRSTRRPCRSRVRPSSLPTTCRCSIRCTRSR